MNKDFEEYYSYFLNNYTKEELARMLALQKQINDAIDKKLDEPYVPYKPSTLRTAICNCKSWADCTNPHYDCINCPLRYPYGNGVTTDNKYTFQITSDNSSASIVNVLLEDDVRNKA